ncbi:MAG: chemotaxis protein CheD [Piscinibacter sp.]
MNRPGVGAAEAGALHVLHPGDVACGNRGEQFETLLGSCVAVILTDPRRTVGAMCHIVHAAPAPAHARKDAHYADAALAAMHALLRARAIEPGLCDAYVYGGGNMFPGLYSRDTIGERNVRRVLDTIAATGVNLIHEDVGGHTYRRLRWTVGPAAPSVTAVSV